MRNIIKDVAAKNAVPWGEIAEKIDENFSEVDTSFVKGIKVNGSTITSKNENGVMDIGNLTDIYIIPYFTMEDIEQLYNGSLDVDEISYDFGPISEAARSKKTLCVWDSKYHNGLSVASWALFRTLEITGLRYYSLDITPEGILNRSMIQVTNILESGRRSPYITNFSIADATSGREVRVSRDLLNAAYLGAPVMIRTDNGSVTSIYTYVDNPNNHTHLYLEASDRRQKYQLIFSSDEIIPENGSMSIAPDVKIIPAGLSIVNSTGEEAQSIDNAILIPAGFFSDKSVEYNTANEQTTMISISNQITMFDKPLLGDGQFRFPAPTKGAVEYAVKFRVGTQCSWTIGTTEGRRLGGYFFGRTLSNIPVGVYMMKITLVTDPDVDGKPIIEFIAEIMQSIK